MGRPLNRQRFLLTAAPHQIQCTTWGTADSGATAGYLHKQNSPRRFRTTTVNGTSLTNFTNGPGNLVSGTTYVKVFPVGTQPTTYATGNVTLKSLATGNAVTSGGAGYKIGDTLTFVGGTFNTAATVTVTANSAVGAVTSVSTPVIAGIYSAPPANVSAIPVTGGNGAGAILSFNFGVNTANVSTAGVGYTSAVFVVDGGPNQGDTVSPTFTQPVVSSGAVTLGPVTVLTPGIINFAPVVTIEEQTGATEYVSTLTSMNYVNTYSGRQYRWLYKGQAIPSDYATLQVSLAYLDTL